MKDIITFDMTELDLKVKTTLIAHILALGCTVFESHQFMHDIPTLIPFNIPDDSTISSAREGFWISKSCEKNLTDENYGTEISKTPVLVGFIDMGRRKFTPEDAIETIKDLSVQTGRSFRPGNPIESLLFVEQYHGICPTFLALGKIWNGKILQWWGSNNKFHISAKSDKYPSYFKIFIVEDVVQI